MQPTRWSRQIRFLGPLRGFPLFGVSPTLSSAVSLPSSSSSMTLRNSVGAGALHHCVRFASTKLARLYIMELNRVRTDYRRSPTKTQQEECLRAITDTPLHRIQGMDGKTVAHCLSTLVLLDAPRDLALLHECAVWLSVHPDAFSPHSLAQALYSLVCLEYADTASIVHAVQDRVMSAIADMAPSSLCMLLVAVLTACAASSDGAVQGALDLSKKLSERVLPTLNAGLGLTEKVMVAVALGKLFEHATTDGLVTDQVLTHLSSSVWAGIPGAELSVVSLPDLLGLVSSVHTAPISVRDMCESALFEELKTRVVAQPLVSARSAVQVARVLKYVIRSSCPAKNDVLEKIVNALEGYISADAITLDTAAKLLAEFSAIEEGSSIVTPSPLIRYLVQAINEGREKWNSESVRTVLRVFSKDEKLRADAQALATLRVEFIQAKCAAGAPVDANDIAALLVEGIVDPHADVLAEAVSKNISRWSVSSVLVFLRAAAEVNGKPTRAIMRDVASKLVPYIEKATSSQVSAVISSYGKARVRNDAFCLAVTNRATLIASELTLHQISTILGGLAAVEYRDTKLFLDLAPYVIAQAPTADAAQTASLLASYSKMLIWNFKVIWSLAERAVVICENFTLPQIIAVVVSLNRMDVQHEILMRDLLKKVMRYVSEHPNISLVETVMILSAFSRSGIWDAAFFEELGKRVVKDQELLTPDELADTLMAFARVGLNNYNIFEKLTLRTLAMAPTSPLMALAHMTVAYASVGCRHEELFSIVADRFVNQKNDVPAVTIASVISAFASVDIRNDRLFIEAIPRVRHVGQYGTPKDITNVVYAYSKVGLWHYKLFVRLADRAIQLRGEFRCDHLTRLLEAYARVDMRYEKLFVEFSPRVQTLAHLLTAGELTKIVNAYARVRILDTAVFKACGDRALDVINTFEEEEVREFLTAFRKTKMSHDGVAAALAKKFPEVVASLPQLEEEQEQEQEEGREVTTGTQVREEEEEKSEKSASSEVAGV
ncbi:uncharacterized protein TM35_000081970 [Trypanosoma theileri]|uniref:RNA-editing substrate-binding complex 6 protein domain-containing protein n=1 Tax=Trypanosoma theileri TaxID=67003 RepID=A0A1X0P1K9_9TRYP|nr:uncharacterized protein TM35_000081970 [Trypanosoma theileri]ORC90399.1 hypothetical protein TM35_000081970 [Trypanosoma theileri]